MKIDLSRLDLSKLPFYIQVGTDLIHAGEASLDRLRQAAADSGADDAQLAKLDALYGDRIAHEEQVDGKGE